MPKFATVIVPVPLPALFTYRVPPEYEGVVTPLMRVVVPFGGRRFYTAMVTEVSDTCNVNYDIKEIAWCPDTRPVLRRPQLQLWEWMADYYMCAIGDVFKAALPAGLKIDSETIVELNDDFVLADDEKFSPKMLKIWEILKTRDKVSVKDLEKDGVAAAMPAVYALMEKGAVTVRERMSERFRPKREEYYEITLERGDDEALNQVFDKMRSARHQKLLMKLLQLSDFTRVGKPLRAVNAAVVKEEECYDRAILKSFEKKGIITINTREISRFKWNGKPLKELPTLSEAQSEALRSIHSQFTDHSVVLLHGVTSSGKTEIFMRLIDFTLKQGKQVLYLVPEIALTTQLTERLQQVFGPKVVIYHSRFSDAERSETWYKLLDSNDPCVVIGARSSVFLPFASLGLVIVDEEHEQSYKQFDPAPRYNGRDVATVLSRMHGAKTLLASATPSVETYAKALDGRYGLVTLTQRFGGNELPDIEIVDMERNREKGLTKESLSFAAITAARNALDNKEQVIFFHNRRGFAPIARCTQCEYIPKCSDCDVSLTYHKRIHRLVCHYCGKEYEMPTLCPVCHQPSMKECGFGTERVEDNVAAQFSDSRILRMDLDTTRNKDNYIGIIDEFSAHKADILVGTQMVTKGLDFGDVSTVVVLNADMLVNYPDFRAAERAFNMLEQVSGRAGRRLKTRGKVLIQTRQPDHHILGFVLRHDYNAYFEHELAERKAFGYPPFTRLIYIMVRHKDAAVCRDAAESLNAILVSKLGNRVYGPHEPAVNRVKTLYIRRIMVKIEQGVSVTQVKQILWETVNLVKGDKRFSGTDFYFDVDPM